jgi:hypothetical protein
MSPSAQRCAFACILRETEIPEPLTELNVLQVRCNFGDGIDIDRRADAGRGLIGDQQAGSAATHEDKLFQQRSQQPGCGEQELPIGVTHGLSTEGG